MDEYERALKQVEKTRIMAEHYYMRVLIPWIDSIKAAILAALQRFDDAINICHELDRPGDLSLAQTVMTYCSCASAYASKGNLEKAREYAKKACGVDPRQQRTLSRVYYAHLSGDIRKSLGSC